MEHPKHLYWKNKGGSEYKITNVPTSLSEQEMLEVVDKICSNPFITYSHSWCEQYLLDWSVEDEGYLSWFERSQLEYDGEILYKEPEIGYEELCSETC
jgi:hypothetical protein